MTESDSSSEEQERLLHPWYQLNYLGRGMVLETFVYLAGYPANKLGPCSLSCNVS